VSVPAYLLNQLRKPSRWVGQLFVRSMNKSHSALTDWGLTHIQIGKGFTILDVGCGGGRTIQKMAAMATEGKVFGVDYADGSIAASRALNARLIQAGRVEIRQASVSELPFPDQTFDLVTAVETHYYWPDLPHDMREVLRVVKPGGMLAIIAEAYKGSTNDALTQRAMALLNAAWLSVDEHRVLLSAAGFTDVQAFEQRDRAWLCVTGRRPNGRRGES